MQMQLMPFKGAGNRTVMQKTTKETTSVVREEVHEKKVVRQNDVTVVIDVSGSMAGGNLEAAKEGVRELYNEVLGKHDRLSLWTFNSSVKMIIPLTKRDDVDIDRVLRDMKVRRLNRARDTCVHTSTHSAAHTHTHTHTHTHICAVP